MGIRFSHLVPFKIVPMPFSQYETNFRKKAKNAGYSEENIQKCLKYAKPLNDRGLPVIYNSANLSALVGYNKKYLKRVAQFTPYFYRTFRVLKANKKKFRTISEPLPSLKEIQKWILDNILYEIPISRFVKSYTPKRSIKDNIKYHKNQTVVLSMDIKDFFPSIKIDRIDTLFLSFGYSPLVSGLLSKICCLNGSLPQGAPTSPYLSNIILKSFDDIMEIYCTENSIRYTRYADDLTYSGDFNHVELISFVKDTLSSSGFILNDQKTRIMKSNQRQLVTGIVVNEKAQVPREIRKKLRQEAFYIEKYGLDDHIRFINNSNSNYIEHLLGIAKYIFFINPKDCEAPQIIKTLEKYKK